MKKIDDIALDKEFNTNEIHNIKIRITNENIAVVTVFKDNKQVFQIQSNYCVLDPQLPCSEIMFNYIDKDSKFSITQPFRIRKVRHKNHIKIVIDRLE